MSSNSPVTKKKSGTPGTTRRNSADKGPQVIVLEQCIGQLFKAIKLDSTSLQRNFIMLGIGDPTVIRSKTNVNQLLGEYVEPVKLCTQALTVLVKTSPGTFSDELKQNMDFSMYLLGPLAERITLFDLLKDKPRSCSSIDHRFWETMTPQDRYRSMILFYCKILRLYVDRNPGAFGKSLKMNFDFLLYSLRTGEEIMADELVNTTQSLVLGNTECLPYFMSVFIKVSRDIMMDDCSEKEAFLEPEDVQRVSKQYYINLANVMSYAIVRTVNDEARSNMITENLLSMNFFPIVLAASFRASSCKGYLPLFYHILDTKKDCLQASQMNAIESQIDRIAKIIRHATENQSYFGIVRFHALKLLIPLMKFEYSPINRAVYNLRILPLLLRLMFDVYPHASLLHNVIGEVFKEIFVKSRRNKSDSIYSLLLNEEGQTQLSQMMNILVDKLNNREFGVSTDVGFSETGRTILMLFDTSSKLIKDVLKLNPELALQWKTISKASKSYSTSLEKYISKSKKVAAQAKKVKASPKSGQLRDVDDEFSVVQKLKEIDVEEEVSDSSVRQLKRKMKRTTV